jgi:hypothetical protein
MLAGNERGAAISEHLSNFLLLLSAVLTLSTDLEVVDAPNTKPFDKN